MISLPAIIADAYAMGPAPQGGGQAGGGVESLIGSLLPLILIFVVFYFLLIRPQQKKAKEHKMMMDNLKKGDKIISAGGIYGVVESVETKTVTVKIAENVRIKLGKTAVAAVRATSDED